LSAGSCPGNSQYIYIEARPAGANDPINGKTAFTNTGLPQTLASFGRRHTSNVSRWRSILLDSPAKDLKVVVWGSGGKGVSVLNALGPETRIQYVVDINPSRCGRFVPGSAQQIVPPEFLSNYRPDIVIISNPAYESEIRQQLGNIGLSPGIRCA
jgi:hypothetical protein